MLPPIGLHPQAGQRTTQSMPRQQGQAAPRFGAGNNAPPAALSPKSKAALQNLFKIHFSEAEDLAKLQAKYGQNEQAEKTIKIAIKTMKNIYPAYQGPLPKRIQLNNPIKMETLSPSEQNKIKLELAKKRHHFCKTMIRETNDALQKLDKTEASQAIKQKLEQGLLELDVARKCNNSFKLAYSRSNQSGSVPRPKEDDPYSTFIDISDDEGPNKKPKVRFKPQASGSSRFETQRNGSENLAGGILKRSGESSKDKKTNTKKVRFDLGTDHDETTSPPRPEKRTQTQPKTETKPRPAQPKPTGSPSNAPSFIDILGNGLKGGWSLASSTLNLFSSSISSKPVSTAPATASPSQTDKNATTENKTPSSAASENNAPSDNADNTNDSTTGIPETPTAQNTTATNTQQSLPPANTEHPTNTNNEADERKDSILHGWKKTKFGLGTGLLAGGIALKMTLIGIVPGLIMTGAGLALLGWTIINCLSQASKTD